MGDAGPKPTPRLDVTGVKLWSGLDWVRIVCRLGHSVTTAPEVVVRTSIQKKIGGYGPKLPHTGDLEMWLRFALRSDVAYIKGADQAFYRSHGTNMTVDRVPLVDLQQRTAAFEAMFESSPDRIPDAARLRTHVSRRIAKEALWEACRAYHRRPGDRARATELQEFARRIYPRCDRLPEYWGLRWRERAGPDLSASLRPLMMSAVRRRLRSNLWWRRWEREGV